MFILSEVEEEGLPDPTSVTRIPPRIYSMRLAGF